MSTRLGKAVDRASDITCRHVYHTSRSTVVPFLPKPVQPSATHPGKKHLPPLPAMQRSKERGASSRSTRVLSCAKNCFRKSFCCSHCESGFALHTPCPFQPVGLFLIPPRVPYLRTVRIPTPVLLLILLCSAPCTHTCSAACSAAQSAPHPRLFCSSLCSAPMVKRRRCRAL